MKLLSWNINGLRAVVKKGFLDFVAEQDPDILCLQETKLQEPQMEELFKDAFFAQTFEGYHNYWHYAERKGYSGTAVFSKTEPERVRLGIGNSAFDCEGRVITLEFPDLFVVCVYSPNAQDGLARIGYREAFEDAFREYLAGLLETGRTVTVCGDMNVAHNEIDLARPKENVGNAGFSDQERAKFNALLQTGFIDSFRTLYPGATDSYSWWSYRGGARARNVGWRIDYWLVSAQHESRIEDALILYDVEGSDHCPVGLLLK